jgi:hypothetical protein
MMKEDLLGVALVKEACPLCGALEDGPIILNKRLTPDEAKKVKALDGQTVGYMDHPCKECQEIMDQAFLFIGVVEAKSDDMKNPYRSGNKWGVRLEYAKKLLGEDGIKKGAAFISVEEAVKLGFPNCNLNA